MRRIYSLLINCAVPFAFAAVVWRSWRDPAYRGGWSERFGRGGKRHEAPTIWVHAVSLGEMTAGAPLIRALRARFPQWRVALTTATPAGRARAQALFPDIDVRFLPYDTRGGMRRLLARLQPRIAIIMETELWPNLFDACRREAVPLLLASARLSPKSVSRYRRFGTLFRVFGGNVVVAAQSEEDRERFLAIGAAAERCTVIGNVKFDIEVDAANVELGRRLRRDYGAARPVWIAGSTHAGEDEQVLEAHQALCAGQPEALLLLAPRHRERFDKVAELLTSRGLNWVRRSTGEVPQSATAVKPATAVVLIDTLGELAALYAAADVAFVGGSLVPIGGHNLLEPAALGLPVLTGPAYFNSREIGQLLLREGAALQVNGAQELSRELARLLSDPDERRRVGGSGLRLVESNRGSVARLLEIVAQLLASPSPT